MLRKLFSVRRSTEMEVVALLAEDPSVATRTVDIVRSFLHSLQRHGSFVRFAMRRYIRAATTIQRFVRVWQIQAQMQIERAAHAWLQQRMATGAFRPPVFSSRRRQQAATVPPVGAEGVTADGAATPPSGPDVASIALAVERSMLVTVVRSEWCRQRAMFQVQWRSWRKQYLAVRQRADMVENELEAARAAEAKSTVSGSHVALASIVAGQSRLSVLRIRLAHAAASEPRFRFHPDEAVMSSQLGMAEKQRAARQLKQIISAFGVESSNSNALLTTVQEKIDRHLKKAAEKTMTSVAKPNLLSSSFERSLDRALVHASVAASQDDARDSASAPSAPPQSRATHAAAAAVIDKPRISQLKNPLRRDKSHTRWHEKYGPSGREGGRSGASASPQTIDVVASPGSASASPASTGTVMRVAEATTNHPQSDATSTATDWARTSSAARAVSNLIDAVHSGGGSSSCPATRLRPPLGPSSVSPPDRGSPSALASATAQACYDALGFTPAELRIPVSRPSDQSELVGSLTADDDNDVATTQLLVGRTSLGSSRYNHRHRGHVVMESTRPNTSPHFGRSGDNNNNSELPSVGAKAKEEYRSGVLAESWKFATVASPPATQPEPATARLNRAFRLRATRSRSPKQKVRVLPPRPPKNAPHPEYPFDAPGGRSSPLTTEARDGPSPVRPSRRDAEPRSTSPMHHRYIGDARSHAEAQWTNGVMFFATAEEAVLSPLAYRSLGALVPTRPSTAAHRFEAAAVEHTATPSRVSPSSALHRPVALASILQSPMEAACYRSQPLAPHKLWSSHRASPSCVACVLLDDESAVVCTGGFDGVVSLWQFAGNVVAKSRDRFVGKFGHRDRVTAAVFFNARPTLVVTISDDGTAIVADCTTGGVVATLRGHTSWICCVAVIPDVEPVDAVAAPAARMLATAGYDSDIFLWDAATWTVASVCRGHAGAVMSLVFSSEGHALLSGGSDGVVRVWKLMGWGPFTAASSASPSVQASGGAFDGSAQQPTATTRRSFVLTVEKSGIVAAVYRWEQPTHKSYVDHEGSIIHIERVLGNVFASAGGDGSVRLFDAITLDTVATFAFDPATFCALAVCGGAAIVVARSTGSVTSHSCLSGNVMSSLDLSECITALAAVPDYPQCVIAFVSSRTLLVDAVHMQPLCYLLVNPPQQELVASPQHTGGALCMACVRSDERAKEPPVAGAAASLHATFLVVTSFDSRKSLVHNITAFVKKTHVDAGSNTV